MKNMFRTLCLWSVLFAAAAIFMGAKPVVCKNLGGEDMCDSTDHGCCVVMFYNLENMFDTTDDPTARDEDMLPLSDRHWTAERYTAKIANLTRVIGEIAAEEEFPSVICVAEVENREVLEDIVASEALRAAHYEICHYDSPDSRGIDVAILYRPDVFRVEGSRAYRAETGVEADNPTRDHLAVWGSLDGEKVFIVGVHWPSRIGGEQFTSSRREACGRQVREIVDSVRCAESKVRVIIMGDMNDNPDDRSVASSLGAVGRLSKLSADGYYTPFLAVKHSGRGTTVYDGRWNLYDNIIVSADMVRSVESGHLHLCSRRGSRFMGYIFSRDFMTTRAGHPRPTYEGSAYIGGCSDHLPVYILLGR